MPDLIQKLRDETFENALEILETFMKCIIIRPTSFGKTGILVRFLKRGQRTSRYERIVYMYPNDITYRAALRFYYGDNIPDNPTIPNVTFISYTKLTMMSEQEMKQFKDTDLIITDESHKLGATETSQAFEKFLKIAKKAYLLGATATPIRSDRINVVKKFFDEHVTYTYTLHNAFEDGVLKKPYYCYNTYDPDTLLENVAKATRRNIKHNKKKCEAVLKSRLIEIAKLSKMDEVIRETCDEHAKDTNYMKFIVFFSTINHIHEKSESVIGWFQKAYPNHTVNTLCITSESKETADNRNKLDNLIYRNKTIDLIFCRDMLNLGYHVDNLTGICMYRGTMSNIVYIQQLGRALNANYAGIIFDWIDNLHRPTAFQILKQNAKRNRNRKKRFEYLKAKIEIPNPNNPPTDEEIAEYETLKKLFESKKDYEDNNDIGEHDLIATSHEATLRELIDKTENEPEEMLWRFALDNYRENGYDTSILTQEHLQSQIDEDSGEPIFNKYLEWQSQSAEKMFKKMNIPKTAA